ncbi:MAG: transporter, partial [Burkholderiales bacterium]|nr:transporter [Burkholderiales bacterium]
EFAEGRWQTTWAGAVSRALNERWSIGGEVSASCQTGTPNTGQMLAAVSYSASKRMVFDLGVARGLNRASPHWGVFAGVTVLLGRLF